MSGAPERSLPVTFILEDCFRPYRELIQAHGGSPLRFEKGREITSGSARAQGLYFLLDGVVKVSVFNAQGYERILGYHKQNTFFAMDALRPEETLLVTTTAVTNVSALSIPPETLHALMQDSVSFAEELVKYYGDVLRLMCYDAESQTSGGTLTRLANFLVLYMQSSDYRRLGYIPLSQAELASAIGTSRIQVARICAELKAQGTIAVQKRRLYILDQERIYQEAACGRQGPPPPPPVKRPQKHNPA